MPSCGLAGIDGLFVTVGGVRTRAVTADGARADPAVLAAVTTTRSVLPSSAAVTVYDAAVAPAIGWQPVPVAEQRSHA